MMGTRQTYQRPPHLDVTDEQKAQNQRGNRRVEAVGNMNRKNFIDLHRSLFALVSVRLGIGRPVARAKDTEWPTYGADLAGTRYRPLDQINASNFNKLEVAWRFKTDSLGNRPEYKLEGTPLMVNGVVYATAGSRRAAIALDAATGELLWVHGEHEGARGAAAPRQLSGRGLAYWSDGKEERILYVTPGYRLIALDAKTGALGPVASAKTAWWI